MVNQTYTKTPVKTTKIHPEFSGGRLTNYAGLVPFADFLFDKLCFGPTLAEQLDLGMGLNCSYADEQVFGLIIFGYLCGDTPGWSILNSSVETGLSSGCWAWRGRSMRTPWPTA